MKVSKILAIILALISLSLPACHMYMEGKEQSQEEHHKIVVTTPQAKDVIITRPYVCQIRARRHIDVRALEDGYLKEIFVKEGQAVKKDEVMFEINPTLYKAKYEAELAEARNAEIELENTEKLYEQKVVSIQDVMLHKAKLARAKANAAKAKAEWDFCSVTAPFDGIVDRLQEREGSLIKERDILTTLSDNHVMWVYFNVPEKQYLEYMEEMRQGKEIGQIELKLANGNIFHYPSMGVTIEAKFNNETGNIKFRADFENPHGLLRHGQTGTVLIHRTLNALVIPQRATFELLDKLYVYVVGEDDVVHRRLITIQHEPGLEDIFIIKSGLDVKDKIVLEGVREVHDDGKVEYEFRKPEEALANQKNRAE